MPDESPQPLIIPSPDVEKIARRVAGRLARDGAQAVILVGSHVRGDAHRESDIDLHAIGTGPHYTLSREDDTLVSVSWRAAEQHRDALKSLPQAIQTVPAWRSAILLHDPEGIASALQGEARAWSWDTLDAKPDTLAAAGVTGCAEEVHKLVISLETGRRSTAAIQRNVLAMELPQAMALRKRLLIESENHLWDLVAAAMGDEWARCQSAAFGLADEPFEATCRAALKLYRLAAAEVESLLDASQRAVVAHACALAETALTRDDGKPPHVG